MDLNKVKELLRRLLSEVQRRIGRLTKENPASDDTRALSNTIEEDVTEAESGFRIGELLDQAKNEEDRLTQAINRVDEGSYGKCQRCGKEISPERLAARPDARYCIDCQRIMDAQAEAAN